MLSKSRWREFYRELEFVFVFAATIAVTSLFFATAIVVVAPYRMAIGYLSALAFLFLGAYIIRFATKKEQRAGQIWRSVLGYGMIPIVLLTPFLLTYGISVIPMIRETRDFGQQAMMVHAAYKGSEEPEKRSRGIIEVADQLTDPTALALAAVALPDSRVSERARLFTRAEVAAKVFDERSEVLMLARMGSALSFGLSDKYLPVERISAVSKVEKMKANRAAGISKF